MSRSLLSFEESEDLLFSTAHTQCRSETVLEMVPGLLLLLIVASIVTTSFTIMGFISSSTFPLILHCESDAGFFQRHTIICSTRSVGQQHARLRAEVGWEKDWLERTHDGAIQQQLLFHSSRVLPRSATHAGSEYFIIIATYYHTSLYITIHFYVLVSLTI